MKKDINQKIDRMDDELDTRYKLQKLLSELGF